MRKVVIQGFKARYLYIRGDGNYVYRRLIPADYRILANGKREFKESLRTRKHTDAIARYGETNGKYEAIFDQLKKGIALNDQQKPSLDQLKAWAKSHKMAYKSVDAHMADPNERDMAVRFGKWVEAGKPVGMEMDAIFGSAPDEITIKKALEFYEEQNRADLIGLTSREKSKKLTPVWMITDSSGKRLYLTAAERHSFLQTAARMPGEVRSFCETLHYTGCRISEALNLTVDRIDLDNEVVVFETLKKRRTGVYRSVPVPAELLNTLELVHQIRRPGKANRLLWSWSRVTAWRHVKAVMKEARIQSGPQTSPKGLRHGYGVNAVTSGVPLNMLSKWMGHSAIETTSIYTNAVGEEQKQISARMWATSA